MTMMTSVWQMGIVSFSRPSSPTGSRHHSHSYSPRGSGSSRTSSGTGTCPCTSNIFYRVVDPDGFDTDPDPAFMLNPDPVPDPDPSLKQNFRTQFFSQIFLKSKFESNQIKNTGVFH
jgi:hypothetical protein